MHGFAYQVMAAAGRGIPARPITSSVVSVAAPLSTLEIYAISLLVLHWTVVFTVAIGAFIVMVMKGPAYVADAYPMQGMDRPDVPLPPGPTSTEKGAMKP